MLNDNIKNLRKSKGLSQEELAMKLNVVRQTVSKWEKGLSVPDCEMLIKIADALGTQVNVLLDKTIEPDDTSEIKIIANKLEIINEQIAKYNESRRKKLKAVCIIIFIVSVCVLVLGTLVFINQFNLMNDIDSTTAIIGGADGPTAIFVARSNTSKIMPLIASFAVAVASFAGIYKNRKR